MLIDLINIVFRGAVYLILASVILSIVGRAGRARWVHHPIPLTIILAGDALCRPFRRLLGGTGMSTGPFDFSPLIAVVVIQILHRVVLGLVTG
jgi:uncharacterized protein YggT (Ycf19 family)